jgi:hypothetical protein
MIDLRRLVSTCSHIFPPNVEKCEPHQYKRHLTVRNNKSGIVTYQQPVDEGT